MEMRKRIIYGVFCLFLCAPNAALASEQSDAVKDLIEQMKNPAVNEEILVQQLFKLPFEYRQYVFPALHEMRGLSYKTRTMPEIAEWKGKKPTRLAPEVQEFTKEQLDYLSPALYPSLMPEVWHSFYQNKDVYTQNKIPPTYSFEQQIFKVIPSRYPNLEEKNIRPFHFPLEETGDLTVQDVQNVMSAINALKSFEKTEKGQKVIKEIILALPAQDVFQAMENPCLSLMDRLYHTDGKNDIDEILLKNQLTRLDFSNKCDRTLKAFRVLNAPPSVIRSLKKTKSDFMLKGNTLSPMLVQGIKTTLALFQTKRADIYVVRACQKDLNTLLRPRYVLLGTPILLDF